MRYGRALLLVYLVALHAALAVAVLRPDAVARRVRLLWPDAAGEPVSEFRRGMVAMQRGLEATIRPGAVWVFGDSIVQMMDVGRLAPGAVNLGIGEDTIAGLLARLPDHPRLADAAAIVLAIGTNDLAWRSPEQAASLFARPVTPSSSCQPTALAGDPAAAVARIPLLRALCLP